MQHSSPGFPTARRDAAAMLDLGISMLKMNLQLHAALSRRQLRFMEDTFDSLASPYADSPSSAARAGTALGACLVGMARRGAALQRRPAEQWLGWSEALLASLTPASTGTPAAPQSGIARAARRGTTKRRARTTPARSPRAAAAEAPSVATAAAPAAEPPAGANPPGATTVDTPPAPTQATEHAPREASPEHTLAEASVAQAPAERISAPPVAPEPPQAADPAPGNTEQSGPPRH